MTVLIISTRGQLPQARDAHPENTAALIRWLRAQVGSAPHAVTISTDHIMWTRNTGRGPVNKTATALARVARAISPTATVHGPVVITGRRREFPASLTTEQARRIYRAISDARRATT